MHMNKRFKICLPAFFLLPISFSFSLWVMLRFRSIVNESPLFQIFIHTHTHTKSLTKVCLSNWDPYPRMVSN